MLRVRFGDDSLTRIGCEFIDLGLYFLGDCAKKVGMDTKNTSATARVERPHRSQVEMQFFSLDQLLPGPFGPASLRRR